MRSRGSCLAHWIGLRPPRLCHHFANLVGTISKRRAHNVYLRRCSGSPIVVARGHLSFPRERRSKNDLEDSKNRGSSGGDGNQHVRLRGSQIGSCDNYRIRPRRTVVATMCPKKGRPQSKDDCNSRMTATCGPPPCPRSSAFPRLQLRCASLRQFSCLVPMHWRAGHFCLCCF